MHCSAISLMQKNFSFKLISFVTLTDFISFLLGIIFAFLGYGVWSLVYVAIKIYFKSSRVFLFCSDKIWEVNFILKNIKNYFLLDLG